jgi:hypothetical protein
MKTRLAEFVEASVDKDDPNKLNLVMVLPSATHHAKALAHSFSKISSHLNRSLHELERTAEVMRNAASSGITPEALAFAADHAARSACSIRAEVFSATIRNRMEQIMTDHFDWTEGELAWKDGDFVPPAKMVHPLVYVDIDDQAGSYDELDHEHQQLLREEARRAEVLGKAAEKQGNVHWTDIVEPDRSPE